MCWCLPCFSEEFRLDAARECLDCMYWCVCIHNIMRLCFGLHENARKLITFIGLPNSGKTTFLSKLIDGRTLCENPKDLAAEGFALPTEECTAGYLEYQWINMEFIDIGGGNLLDEYYTAQRYMYGANGIVLVSFTKKYTRRLQ